MGLLSKFLRRPTIRKSLIVASIAPEWMASDIINLRHFFMTDTGKKLLQRAHAMEYANAVAACQDVFHTSHSAGRALGCTETIKWFESQCSDEFFSRVSGDQDTKQDTTNLSQDERKLVETLSP